MTNQNTSVDNFDAMAATMDEEPGIKIFAMAIADRIKDELPLSKTVKAFEFGCGTGLVTISLAETLDSVIAVDSSEKMLDQLRKKIGESEIHNITPLLQPRSFLRRLK